MNSIYYIQVRSASFFSSENVVTQNMARLQTLRSDSFNFSNSKHVLPAQNPFFGVADRYIKRIAENRDKISTALSTPDKYFLSQLEVDVLQAVLAGQRVTDIAKARDCTQGRVSVLVQGALNKILDPRPPQNLMQLVKAFKDQIVNDLTSDKAALLSPVERATLELALTGLSNPSIAEQMNVTRGRVTLRLSRALRKLGYSPPEKIDFRQYIASHRDDIQAALDDPDKSRILTPVQRTCLIAILDGKTTRQIQQEFDRDISLGSVRSLIKKALHELAYWPPLS